MMTFEEWLREEKLTVPEFAEAKGYEKQTLYNYLQGRRTPKPEEMRRIYVDTDGKVTPNDWVLPKAACAGGGVAADAAA